MSPWFGLSQAETSLMKMNVMEIALVYMEEASFSHPQDGGKYCCIATNKYGTHNKEVELHVKSLNIQIFPVSVASTFVTLSWNTSKSLSSDYILQVEQTE